MTRFWETKILDEMNQQEWESLCDGCARCCMVKLQDEDTEIVHYTALVCDLLDQSSCRCTRYPERHQLVPNCVIMNPERARSFDWLPTTCAYRTLAEGRPLAWWHPLVSGSDETVHEAGISVRGKVIAESEVHEDEAQEMLIDWVQI
ncbi:MAG TPA: YcgN family cysteine cluster protein [Gammaproteobacteria bacterium]|nr:YcgN family cysteine cluster protein [Gammaproteobacteria bacterium]|tara:strand:- start:7172 stop:7612 length:441 start_codon:yes stop_codon:yes gene_type:complete